MLRKKSIQKKVILNTGLHFRSFISTNTNNGHSISVEGKGNF